MASTSARLLFINVKSKVRHVIHRDTVPEIIDSSPMSITDLFPNKFLGHFKGQLISKANCQAVNSSKKRTNEFVFTSMRRVFVRFLEEIEDSKKAFRNYLTFNEILD